MEDKDLMAELKQCFKAFLVSNRKDKTLIDPLLHDVFSKAEKPYDRLLLLIRDLKEFEQPKSTTLSVYLSEFFENWIKENGTSQVIDKALKDEALLTVCGRSTHITNVFIRIFEIDKETPESFLSVIDDLVHQQMYDVASRLVAALRLTSKVSIFKFLIPLIGQDKVVLVESYLDQAGKTVQLELMEYLDSCIATKDQLREKLIELGVPKVCNEKLFISSFAKLVGRLAKKYEIPEKSLPFYYRRRVGATIRYLAQQCFKEQKITPTNFEELTTLEVKDSWHLQVDLLKILIDHEEIDLALRMAQNLGLPLSKWPWRLRDGETAEQLSEIRRDESVSTGKFYELPFPLEHVIYVDTKEKFDEFLIVLTKEEIIGIDAEWPPSFDGKKPSVSLISIATRTENIYLLDMISLEKCLSTDQRQGFADCLCREDLLVLGFAIKDCMNFLNPAFPAIGERFGTTCSALDLLKLWSHIQQRNPIVFPYPSVAGENKGLSELVSQCFNVTLDKREQMSNWGRRPLTQSQITYAAIDAHVLMKIFVYMSGKYSPEVWKDLVDPLKEKKKEKKPQKVKNLQSSENDEK